MFAPQTEGVELAARILGVTTDLNEMSTIRPMLPPLSASSQLMQQPQTYDAVAKLGKLFQELGSDLKPYDQLGSMLASITASAVHPYAIDGAKLMNSGKQQRQQRPVYSYAIHGAKLISSGKLQRQQRPVYPYRYAIDGTKLMNTDKMTQLQQQRPGQPGSPSSTHVDLIAELESWAEGLEACLPHVQLLAGTRPSQPQQQQGSARQAPDVDEGIARFKSD
eukprot:gene20603-27402_t